LKQAHIYGAFTDDAANFVAHANAKATEVQLTHAALADQLRRMTQSPFYKGWIDYIPRLDSPNSNEKAKMALLPSRVVGLIFASAEAGGPGGKMSVEKALSIALQPVEVPGALFGTKKIPAYLLGTVESKNPRTWPTATKVAFINTDYYTTHYRFPTDAEMTKLLNELNK